MQVFQNHGLDVDMNEFNDLFVNVPHGEIDFPTFKQLISDRDTQISKLGDGRDEEDDGEHQGVTS